jgi:hypothetical protein
MTKRLEDIIHVLNMARSQDDLDIVSELNNLALWELVDYLQELEKEIEKIKEHLNYLDNE